MYIASQLPIDLDYLSPLKANLKLSMNGHNADRSFQSEPSETKRNLIKLLEREIEELHVGIMEMDESALLKQLAKRKLIYKFTNYTKHLELIYAYIALAEYYVSSGFYEAAVKNLFESIEIQPTGEALYLIGKVYYEFYGSKTGIKDQEKRTEAKQFLEEAVLATEEQIIWIQPSIEHRTSNRLQCMTLLQKVYFDCDQKDKLMELSKIKIKETQKLGRVKGGQESESYFLALSLADLAIIHEAFGEYTEALKKIDPAILMLQTRNENSGKLIEFYLLKGKIHEQLEQKFVLSQIQDDKQGINYTGQKGDFLQSQSHRAIRRDAYAKAIEQIEYLSKSSSQNEKEEVSKAMIAQVYEKFIRVSIV